MVDQEGGIVKRLSGPPRTSARAMRQPEREGAATGRMLRRLGITVDLAPVAAVAHPGTFLGSRAFGTTAREVTSEACAFATGVRGARVAATLKHFPGLGTATTNTDDQPTSIALSRAALKRDLEPYRRCARDPGTLVMVASASYPNALGAGPAVLSKRTYAQLDQLGATAPTISDDLETPAIANQRRPARRAINAGLDLLLYARTEQASASAYLALLKDVRAGRIDERRIQAAADEVLALKALLAR